MLEKLGFKEERIRKDNAVVKDGEILLSSQDLLELASAMKIASFNKNDILDPVELARGSELIKDPQSRLNIANFFKEYLEIDESRDLLSNALNPQEGLKARLESVGTAEARNMALFNETMKKMHSNGMNESAYMSAINTGNADLLSEIGIATFGSDGSLRIDQEADTRHAFENYYSVSGNLNHNVQLSDRYGGVSRIQEKERIAEENRLKAIEEAKLKKKKEQEKAARKRNMSPPEQVQEKLRNFRDKIKDDSDDESSTEHKGYSTGYNLGYNLTGYKFEISDSQREKSNIKVSRELQEVTNKAISICYKQYCKEYVDAV